jgi:hypothetical protein
MRRGLGLAWGALLAVAVLPSQALAASWGRGAEAKLGGASLDSVSCSSAGECSAVGSAAESEVLLTESGGAWGSGSDATLPPTAGVPIYFFPSTVSCGAPGNCGAVTTYNTYLGNHMSASHGLLLSETSGRWAAGVNPTPDVNLNSVSCPSAGNCTAVGDVVLSEAGGTWEAGMQPNLPSNAISGWLSSVWCASAGNCTAVGSYRDNSGLRGLLLTETDGTWGPGVEAVLPSNAGPDPNVSLGSVSCAAPGDCGAVGTYADSSHNNHWLLLSESGGSWSPGIEATLPPNAGPIPNRGDSPASVSCPSVGNCSAVGTYVDTSGNEQGLLVSESGGSWTSGVEATLPANAAQAPFPNLEGPVSVSCASAGNCTAVGRYALSSFRQRPFLLSESGGTWLRGVQPALPANANQAGDADLESVSCAAGGDCSAVGLYDDKSGHTEGLLVGSLAVLSRLRASATPLADGRIKLSVGYRLNIPARVTIRIKRVLAGRLGSAHGSLATNGKPGQNRITFDARNLAPGRYELIATPSFGRRRSLTFSVSR